MTRHPATVENQEPNRKLLEARRSLRSPHHPDQPMSRKEMADAVNAALDFLYPKQVNIASYYVQERWVGNLERGDHHWCSIQRRAALRRVTGKATDDEIGLFRPRQAPRGLSAEILADHDLEYIRADGAVRTPAKHRDDQTSQVSGLVGAVQAIGGTALNLDELDRVNAVARDARRYSDSTVVEYLNACLSRCAAEDGMYGPRHALPGALGIAALVQHAARQARSELRRPLLAVGARAAEFAGWLYRDSGQSGAAEYWRDRATEWSMEAADFAMPGYILIKKSQSAWDDRDAGRMLGLAQAVQEGPWQLPARVMAEAVQQQARGLAMLNTRRTEVDDTLKQAGEFLSLGTHDRTPLAAHYDAVLFRVQTAICYGESRRPEEAVDIYESALTPAMFSARDYAYFSTLKAQTLVAADRPDDAASTGVAALGGAFAAGSARTVRELSRLRVRLDPWRARPAVHEFVRLMEAA